MGLFADTSARQNDSLALTLKKILQVYLDGGGGNMLFANDQPDINDSVDITIKKILDVLNDGGGGGGGGGAVLRGVGSPEGVVTANVASLYYTSTNPPSVWVFNGTLGTNTGWVQIIG